MARVKTSANEVVPAAAARRMLMHAQGLLDNPDQRATPATLQRLIARMGFVQIDSINVVERAHHLTLFARRHEYAHQHLAHLHERKRTLFEHWTHDASLLPIEFFAHWKHRKARFVERGRVLQWCRTRMGKDYERILAHALARIENEGPLMARDFEHQRPAGSGGASGGAWWGWKPQKAALEYLWWRGDLTVVRREHFQKVYDLTARAHPEHHALDPPAEEEYIDWACAEAMARLIVASPAELAAFWNAITLKEARTWCERALARGEVVPVEVESEDQSPPKLAYALHDWNKRSRRAARALAAMDDRLRLLAPFDPVLRDRQRALRLFNFDYRFEAFVPAPKRIYGYYVLPILQGERLIGRCDVKHHRAQSTLEIKGLWWESDVRPTRPLRAKFDEAAERLATFIGADHLERPS